MAEQMAQQMARLQVEVQNLQAQLQTRPPATKDLSLVALVPKWAGTDKAISLKEFFDTIESTARIGNWSNEDMVRIATLKLTDVARTFYNGTLELHDQNITWTAFKAAFQARFRDVRTDQYHFTQLQMARQRKDESVQEYADRCRSLAQKTVPQVDDPAIQKIHYEQAERMLLATFTAGLLSAAGRQVRYAMPRTMDEAIKIAITVNQAEMQERRNEAFYVDEAREAATANRHTRGMPHSGSVRNTTPQAGAGRRQIQNRKEPSRNSGNGDDRRCFECGGLGHWARNCANRQSRSNSRNPTNRSGNAPQASAGTRSYDASWRQKGRKNDPAAGRREGNESRGGSFHITIPGNDPDYLVVSVNVTKGTPTINATVSGLHRVFIIDTGSSISIIQPGVCSSEVRPTTLCPFGVTGNELEIKGVQEVEFYINNRNFCH
jgi:hypothetical protein